MACSNHLLVEGETLVWHTGLPRDGETRTSPPFSYGGFNWCLVFVNRRITLHRLDSDGDIDETDKELKDPFYIHSYIMHLTERDKVMADVGERYVDETENCLWLGMFEGEGIYEELNRQSDRPEVKFACRFPTPPTILTVSVLHQKSLLESLSSDMSHLLEKELFPDVRLQCGGRTFRAHRSVLAARSVFFRAMFQNETLESQTGEVPIPDMDVAVFQVLLKALYSGRLEDISEGNATDLYKAAEKYAVVSLKAACADWIQRHLAAKNYVRYLVLADFHADKDFKAAVVSFILENPDLLISDEWLALSAELPVLANEVLQAYAASMID